MALLIFLPFLVNVLLTKDPWPVEVFDYLISAYGDPRITKDGQVRYHNGIDIPATQGTPIYEKIGGVLLDYFYANKEDGWKIIIGDPLARKGRFYSHLIPSLEIRNSIPGKTRIKPKTLLGVIYDFNSDNNYVNDHLHYGYVNIDGFQQAGPLRVRIAEAYINPLDRLKITDELKNKLKGKKPEVLEALIFAEDGNYSNTLSPQKIKGKVDIIVHARDEMGQGQGKGEGEPGVYKISWQLIDPKHKNIGNVIEFKGRLKLADAANIHDVSRERGTDFHSYYIVTNHLEGNSYWHTNESRKNPGKDADTKEDAKFPDGQYTIKITIFEHPSLGSPQRLTEYYETVNIKNF